MESLIPALKSGASTILPSIIAVTFIAIVALIIGLIRRFISTRNNESQAPRIIKSEIDNMISDVDRIKSKVTSLRKALQAPITKTAQTPIKETSQAPTRVNKEMERIHADMEKLKSEVAASKRSRSTKG